jgi:hypothetical protein
MTPSDEKRLVRHRRYNVSEKGRARYLSYYWRRGADLRRARAADAVGDWSFAMYMRGEITRDEMNELDPLPPLLPLGAGCRPLASTPKAE